MHLKFSNNFIYRHPINPFSKNTINSEALYLASPVLLEEKLKRKETEKTNLSLKKYQQRASIRCTPFGLFAGCGVGTWGNASAIQKQKQLRHTRLDMNVVCEIASLLESNPIIKTHLTYYTNNSLYKVADKYRYVEYSFENKIRNYQITSIDVFSYINDVLAITKHGVSYSALIECLIDHEVSKEEAGVFTDELIQAQVITTNLSPNVTGAEFFTIIFNTLKEIITSPSTPLPEERGEGVRRDVGEVGTIYTLLIEINNDIKKIDKNFKNEVSAYRLIYDKIKQLLPNLTEENLFQTDLYYQSNVATITADIQKQLTETISFLDKLYSENESENLKKFKEKFQNHYEEQELSLLQVMDTASGIGYLNKDTTGINPIIDDMNYSAKTEKVFDLKWNTVNSLLLKKISQAQINNLQSVEFTDEDIKNKEDKKHSFPPSISIFFSVVSNSKSVIHFKHAGGSSASNLLGRFAHGNKEIHAVINEITEHEIKFHDDKIIAEIVHLPENRIGNILLRPHTHPYELAYLANSIKATENVIDLNDVTVSVRNNKIILRSKAHHKEIIPRLTSAHNFSLSALPVYQFLCDMQNQYYNKTGFSFHWGTLANEFDFLPRATYKNTILAPAQWNIRKEKITEIVTCLKQYNHSKVTAWQKGLNLPKRFLLSDGDNELFINIDDELSVKAFSSAIKKRDNIVLHEFLFDEQDALITDKEGNSYTNEQIAILLNQEKPIQKIIPSQTTDSTKRSFVAGSEWLYYKIYCNPKSAEDILTEKIYPLIQSFKENRHIEKWFFIRYADPDIHIRLRLKLTDTRHLSFIQTQLNELFNPLLENHLIEKIQLDTYNRELERYGFENIDDVETLFNIDSENIVELISELNNDEQGDLIRLKYACLSAYRLMNNFELGKEKLSSLISSSQQSYFNEHGGQKELKLLLDDKYRKYRRSIETLLTYHDFETLNEEDQFVLTMISKKEHLQKQIIHSILQKQKSNNLKADILYFIPSLIHMHVNRLFKSKQRTYELLVYDFLQRILKSIEIRKQKSVSQKSQDLVTQEINL